MDINTLLQIQPKYRFFLTVLVSLSILSYFMIDEYRTINVRNRDYALENFEETTMNKGKLLPATFSFLYQENEEYKYFLNRPDGTGSFINIKKSENDTINSAWEFVRNKKFSEFQMLTHMALYKKNDELDKALDIFFSKEVISESEISSYLSFIDNFYIDPCYFALTQKQYLQARLLIDKAYKLLKKIDTKPLKYLNTEENSTISKVFLTKILLSDLYSICLDNVNLIELYPNINKSSKKLTVKKTYVPNQNSSTQMYENYFYGLNTFRQKDYLKASSIFIYLAQNSQNLILKDISNLMSVRCLVWDCINKKFNNKKQVIESIKKIKKLVREKSLASDVEFYINFLTNPTTEDENDVEKELLEKMEEFRHIIRNKNKVN